MKRSSSFLCLLFASTCVDYYDHHGDAWHRGRAYYYRAGIRMRCLGDMVDGVKDYKVAETIAEDADEELLKNMVVRESGFCQLLLPQLHALTELLTEVP